MATSKACVLFLLISATSALFLSSTVVDAVCVPRKLPIPEKKLPQTRPFSVRTSPAAVPPKKLPKTTAPVVRTSPASVAPEERPQTSAFLIRPLPQPLTSTSSIATEAVQVDNVVVDLCHQTDYPDICIPSVSAYLKGPANTLSVLAAEIEACTEKTKSAARDAARLAADPSVSASESMALSTCTENYGSALDSLSKAQTAIAARDIGTLNSELSAVITYASTCDDSFTEMNVKLPLPGADRILQKLGSNCLAIAAQAHL